MMYANLYQSSKYRNKLQYQQKASKVINYEDIYIYFFSIGVFFHEHSRSTGQQGKGEGIYLTPLYHLQPLHRHLDISRANYCRELTSAHSWQPDSSREPLFSERKSLTTKLRALDIIVGYNRRFSLYKGKYDQIKSASILAHFTQ